MKKLFIFILFLLFAGSSFAQSDYGTYLSRICEFDVKNVKGLTNTGNFIITYEHISYSLDKNGGIDVLFHYKLKKVSQTKTNTFGLSLRNRGMESRGDIQVDTLNVFVNGKRARTNYINSPDELYDDNGMPIVYDSEEHFGWFLSSGYRGWYYFNVDFPESNEADIVIRYKTILDDTYIRYDSAPFWIYAENNLEITIENNYNEKFLSSITGCEPTNTLVTENWKLEKPKQNIINITFTSAWFNENKNMYICFSSVNQPGGPMPFAYFFEIKWENYNQGVLLGRRWNPRNNPHSNRNYIVNISETELSPYELIFLNNWQLRIIRNAFYARYKYRFKDNMLIEILYDFFGSNFRYYNSYNNWYNDNFTEELFSSVEKRNIEIIQRLENMLN